MMDEVMYLAIASPIIPYLIGINKKKKENWLRIVLSMLLLNFCFDILTFTFWKFNIKNYFFFVLYSIALGFLMLKLYSIHMVKHKALLNTILSLFTLTTFISFLLFEIGVVYSLVYLILGAIMIFASIYYFYYELINLEQSKLTKYYFFWVNSGILIYFGVTFLLTFIESVLSFTKNDVIFILWPIQNFSAIILNVFIAIGIWKAKRV